MRSKIKSSFRLRLTLIVLLAIIIPLIAAVSFVSIRGIQRIEDTAKRDLKTQADVLTNAIVSWDDRARLAVQNLSQQPDIESMDPLRQISALTSMANVYKEMFLIHTVDTSGNNISRSDYGAVTNYADREWFQGSMAGNDITRQTLLSRTTGEPSLAYSAPIRNSSGEIIGATLAVSTLDTMAENVADINIGETGFAYVVNEDGIVLAHPDPAFTSDELVDLRTLPPVANLLAGGSGHFEYSDENGVDWYTHLAPLDNGWGVIIQQEKTEALAALSQFVVMATTISLILLLTIGLLTWLAAGRAIRPISTLTDAATAVAAGHLEESVEIKQTDEIGTLANAFNSMTSQLRGLVGNLEKNVADRTRDLALANEVGQTVSEIRETNELLNRAVEIIRDDFDLYIAQMYLVEDDKETLSLQAADGQAADRLLEQEHFLAISTASINGTAVYEKRAVVVSDTSKDPQFRPNPLLPNTRSEMAVPLLVADRAIGVLDLQSTQPNFFTEENVPAFTAMAGQLAIALENATLFSEREKTSAELEAVLTDTEYQAQRLTSLNIMGTQLASATELNEVYQIVGTQLSTLLPDANLTSIALVTDEGSSAKVLRLDGETGAIPTGTTISFTGTVVGLAIQENRLIQLPKESPLSTFTDSRQLAQQGLQSILITPLNANGKIIGTLNIGSSQPYAFSEADVSLLQQTANLLAITIDNTALIERGQRLAAIVENHPDFIGVGTLAGEVLYLNPAGYKLVGLPADHDVTTMTAADFYNSEDAQRLQQEGIPTALAEGFWVAQVQLRKADGTTIPVEQAIAIHYDSENKASSFSMTLRDITERQQAEEFQRKLTTQLEERLLQLNTMQRAMTHEGWSAFLTSPNRLVQGFKYQNNQVGLISMNDLHQGNVPLVSETDSESISQPDLDTATAMVKVRGETIGVIGAKNPDGSPLNEHQLAMLNGFTDQLADALDRSRLFEEIETAREQTNALFSGSEHVLRAQSTEEVLEVLINATQLRKMDFATIMVFDEVWEFEPPEMMTIAAQWAQRDFPTDTPAGTVLPYSQFAELQLVQKDEPVFYNNIQESENISHEVKVLAEGFGVNSIMVWPLVANDQWFGIFMAQSVDSSDFTTEEVRQITGLVDQAAIVIQTQRLFEQFQNRARREQVLREITARVYAAPDAETILKTAVKEVNRIMGVDSFIYLDDQLQKQPAPSNGQHLETEEPAGQEG